MDFSNSYLAFPTKTNVAKTSKKNGSHSQLLGMTITDEMVIDYCSCGFCTKMETNQECVCCVDVMKSKTQYAKNWKNVMNKENYKGCIAKSHFIQEMIHNKTALNTFANVDSYHLKQKCLASGRIYFDEYLSPDENSRFRFISYRCISFSVHDALKVRVELPSCVVNEIRSLYPSEFYSGFSSLCSEE